MLTFEQTKDKLLKRNSTFIDFNFPADERLLEGLHGVDNVVWKRPKELCEEPKFIVNGVSRLDLIQGELANCWFISAAACLAQHDASFFEWCVPLNQSFTDRYAGIFLFNFWEFGSWREIYVDDLLPTKDGKLIFGHNKQEPNEFWVPLFEKAYAKLKGKYSYLDGGQTTYALVDFTGGITERINLKTYRLLSGKLFRTMMKVNERSSMMGCEIVARNGVMESKLHSGLYTGHAYSISTIMNVDTIVGTTVKLLRVRNPWGEGEWNGAWCDGSKEWDSLSDSVKHEIGMVVEDEGEFWMSYDDWLSNFDFLTICHLDANNLTTQVQKTKSAKKEWDVISYHAEWMKGYNAGGSGRLTYKKNPFFTNPQFKITIPHRPPSHPTSPSSPHAPSLPHSPPTTVIISLMQQSRSWEQQTAIGWDIYKVRGEVGDHRSDRKFEERELTFAKTGVDPENLREVTNRIDLSPGNYVVIPYTLNRDVNAKFLLRIFTEIIVNDDKIFNTPTNILPSKKAHFLEQERLEKVAEELFIKFVPSSSQHMHSCDLLMALNLNAKNDGWPGFTSLEASRCLVSVFGVSKPGHVSQQELLQILKDLQIWNDHFMKFDLDRSGSINHSELSSIYRSIGMQLSGRLVRAIVGKYAGRRGEVTLNEFSLCTCKIKHIYDLFKQLSSEGKVHMGLEEWMSAALTM